MENNHAGFLLLPSVFVFVGYVLAVSLASLYFSHFNKTESLQWYYLLFLRRY